HWPLPPIEDKHDVFLPYRVQKAFRSAVREATTNIIRHSQAAMVSVEFALADEFHLTIRDNGKGFPTATDEAGREGYGLGNIERRLSAFGGTFSIAATEAGTEVKMSMPLNGYASDEP